MRFWPPGLLRMTTTLPHILPRRSESSRAMLSGPEPAGCERMRFTALSGQVCAWTEARGSAPATSPRHTRRRPSHSSFIIFSRSFLEVNQPLRFLQARAGRRRNSPVVVAAGGPSPGVGRSDAIAIVDLLDFGRVFDNDATGTDEVVERIVPRPVASWAPLDRMTGVFQTAATAHHRLEIGHEEGDVIEGVIVGIREGDRVMVSIAVHECERTHPVDKPEAKDCLEEALGHRHVTAIEDDMGKTQRAIMAVAGRAGQS